ncbi:MAG: thiamine pyrophosphate-dependent enzyme [Spirochaetia bacterium]
MSGRLEMENRAREVSASGSLRRAVESGALGQFQDVSVSEAIVLGLLNQGVRKYVGVFGHGSTDIANALACYEGAGLVKTYDVRNEVEAAHCATMLRWQYGETAAVITSIGPGAMHAFAGSLASASNGVGVYHIYGDETTHNEGPNMQQIPREQQAGFLALAKTMNAGYQLHTPEAIFAALRYGAATVFNPVHAGPFFLLAPMNVQPRVIEGCNLLELPERPQFPRVVSREPDVYERATRLVQDSQSIIFKLGGGATGCGAEITEIAELIDAVIVDGAKTSGIVPYSHPRSMGVGGSKGSLCGNHAMEDADLVIVVGARAVCQWDCSGTAWRKAKAMINFNTDHYDAAHYNRSIPVVGDAKENLRNWISSLKEKGFAPHAVPSPWLKVNMDRKRQWQLLKQDRYEHPVMRSEVWRREVLTQPAAIKIAYDFAVQKNAARYFDAGDVQANGFQIVEDEREGLTFTETGASYMGFAVSALLAAAVADRPVYTFAFSGDGSFTMNPQVLFDGVEHGVRGCILIFDNRSMGAIAGLQMAQYGRVYKTSDEIAIDYVALANSVSGVKGVNGGHSPEELRRALDAAYAHKGLSVVHVPVYSGEDERGGLGVFGRWNVGNWCDAVQSEHHRIGL